jgi:hypothetical protein
LTISKRHDSISYLSLMKLIIGSYQQRSTLTSLINSTLKIKYKVREKNRATSLFKTFCYNKFTYQNSSAIHSFVNLNHKFAVAITNRLESFFIQDF